MIIQIKNKKIQELFNYLTEYENFIVNSYDDKSIVLQQGTVQIVLDDLS